MCDVYIYKASMGCQHERTVKRMLKDCTQASFKFLIKYKLAYLINIQEMPCTHIKYLSAPTMCDF